MKKLIALTLILCFVISASPAYAVTFTDLDQADWARGYIIDMAERGMYEGYGDGTFKPLAEINLVQVLTILARLSNESADIKAKVLADYTDYITGVLGTQNVAWSYGSIAVCLEAGVITKSELEASAKAITSPVTKEVLSLYLARAMQLEKDALNLTNYTLDYDDYLSISVDKRPYVYLLSLHKIILGDNNNNFNPTSKVNRAVSATMISRTLEYMEANNVQMLLPKYSSYETKGVLESLQSGAINIVGYDGVIQRYSLPSSYSVYVDGAAGVLLSTYAGSAVTLTWSKVENKISAVNIDTKTVIKQGMLKSMSVQSTPEKIYIEDAEKAIVGYDLLSSGTAVYYGDETTTTTKLNTGSFVTIKLKDNRVTEIRTYNGGYEMTGTISSVALGKPISLTILETSGRTVIVKLDPSALPAIRRGDSSTTVDKLREGDTVKITYKNSAVTQIAVDALTSGVSGTVTRLIKDITGSIITIMDIDSKETSYQIASGAVITKNKQKGTLDDINIGSSVTLAVSDNVETAIDVSPKTATTSTVSGAILFVNSTDSSIVLEVTGASGSKSQVTVQTRGYNTKILDASDGTSIALKDLAIYDVIDVYGYNTGLQFDANIIIKR